MNKNDLGMKNTSACILLVISTVIMILFLAYSVSEDSLPEPLYGEGYKYVTIYYGATAVEGYVTEDAYYAIVNRRPKNPIVVYDPYNAELYTEIERSSIRAVFE